MGEGESNRPFRLQKRCMMRHMGEGLPENVRIPSYGGRESKFAQKTII